MNRISKFCFTVGKQTHRVVKFMVKVKLVENSVKSHVGSVIVENVMSQYSTPGTTRKVNSIRRPEAPRIELVGEPSEAVAKAEASVRAEVEAMLIREFNVSDMLAELQYRKAYRSCSPDTVRGITACNSPSPS